MQVWLKSAEFERVESGTKVVNIDGGMDIFE